VWRRPFRNPRRWPDHYANGVALANAMCSHWPYRVRAVAERVTEEETAYGLRLVGLKQVEGWVLSFVVHATIVRPAALAEVVAKAGWDPARRYGRA
jgi:hypothetical protein